MPDKQTHTYYLTKNEETFRLQDMIDNLDGSKQICVKNVTFNKGYYNITNANEIDLETRGDNRPAEKEPESVTVSTHPAPEPTNGGLARREQPVLDLMPGPATEVDLSDETVRQLPLTMPIGEILQPTGSVLNRVLTKMITAYQTDKPEDPKSNTLFKNKWKIFMTYIKTIQT